MATKSLSGTLALAVTALPAPTAALAGLTVRLTTNNKPYWCNGAAWVDLDNEPVTVWCNFNGSGAPSIRGSANVSSVSYSAGLYRVTFAAQRPSVNYAVSVIAVKTGGSGNRRMICDELVKTTGYCEFKLTSTGSGTATNDSDLVDFIVTG